MPNMYNVYEKKLMITHDTIDCRILYKREDIIAAARSRTITQQASLFCIIDITWDIKHDKNGIMQQQGRLVKFQTEKT